MTPSMTTRNHRAQTTSMTSILYPTLLLLLLTTTTEALVGPSRQYSRATMTPTTRVASSAVLETVDEWFQSAPYTAAFVTCSLKASAADFMAQHNQNSNNNNKEEEEDVKAKLQTKLQATLQQEQQQDDSDGIFSDTNLPRNLAFWAYGGLYQGLGQQFLYTVLFPAWFGPTAVLGPLLTDLLVCGPFLCLPAAYVVKQAVQNVYDNNENNNENNNDKTTALLPTAWSKYVADVTERGLLTKYWSVWGPVQCITFGVIPPHLRVCFVAMVSFFWLICLSSIAGPDTKTTTTTTTTIQAASTPTTSETVAKVSV